MATGAEHWVDKEGKKFNSTDTNMYHIDNNNYGVITVKNIDHNLLWQFIKQLKKGFCIHEKGSRGVKHLDEKFSEIKISKKQRLIGYKIKNENNKILHNFQKLSKSRHK